MSESGGNKIAPSSSVLISSHVPDELRDLVKTVLAQIDDLHSLSKPAVCLVETTARRVEQGSYDPASATIFLSRFAMHPVYTFTHEFGHFLDNRILHPIRGGYASRFDGDLERFVIACFRSDSVRAIVKLLRGGRKRLTRHEGAILRNAIEPEELFARAYAQWVAVMSSSAELKGALHQRLNTQYYYAGKACKFEWDEDEFVDIMVELELLFRHKGLV